MRRKPGRPKQLNLITLDEALAKYKEHFQGKSEITKGTLYNKISVLARKGEIKRYGPFHCALLDESEFIEKICS